MEASFSTHWLSTALAQMHDKDKRVVVYAGRPLSSMEVTFLDCKPMLIVVTTPI